jgi:hypothetical protein
MNLPYRCICAHQRFLVLTSLRQLRFFLLAGQAYLQPPDLIELAVRHGLSRSAPYPPAELSATALQWVRPNNISSFPADIATADWKIRLAYLVNFHVHVIRRSSIPEAQGPTNQTLRPPAQGPFNQMLAPPAQGPFNRRLGQILRASTSVKDLTSCYLSGATIAAIEAGEVYKKGRRRARDAFAHEWQRRGFWSVWWWANSEDKARAIIARWMDMPEKRPAPQAGFL